MTPTRAQLQASAQSLCGALASKPDLDTLLAHFSTTSQISVFEHGEPLLAPFVGRRFVGLTGPDSVSAYYALLTEYLTYENMAFDGWVVDTEARKVCVRGTAKFTWAKGAGAGETWDEVFVFVLDFDSDGKVTVYQVWADSGAAYLARRGELGAQRKEYQELGHDGESA